MSSIWSMASDSSYNQSQIGALWPKNKFLAFPPNLLDSIMALLVPGAAGGHFWGMQMKNPSKPIPKNLFRCPELKKSLMGAFLQFK